MEKYITTIEGLARMINEGFKSTASKEDIAQGSAAGGAPPLTCRPGH